MFKVVAMVVAIGMAGCAGRAIEQESTCSSDANCASFAIGSRCVCVETACGCASPDASCAEHFRTEVPIASVPAGTCIAIAQN